MCQSHQQGVIAMTPGWTMWRPSGLDAVAVGPGLVRSSVHIGMALGTTLGRTSADCVLPHSRATVHGIRSGMGGLEGKARWTHLIQYENRDEIEKYLPVLDRIFFISGIYYNI